MGKKLLYDLTDNERALNSLSRLVNIDANKLFQFIKKNLTEEIDYTKIYYDIVKHFEIDIKNLKLDDIEIKSIHVTTGNDDGQSIKRNGLFNLQNVIRENTPLRKFLVDREIRIDIDNKLIKYKEKEIKIQDKSKDYCFEENLVPHKLYEDYLINGFHCKENPITYGGCVAYRPEFISSLEELIGYNNLQCEWKNEFNQCYIVEYKANPYKYEWFNYKVGNMTKDEFEDNPDQCIKKWMIIKAVVVIGYSILGWEKPNIFSYMGFENNVPSSDIINVINVTEKRDQYYKR